MLFIAAMFTMIVFSFLRRNTAVETNARLICGKYSVSGSFSALKSLKIVGMRFSRLQHDLF